MAAVGKAATNRAEADRAAVAVAEEAAAAADKVAANKAATNKAAVGKAAADKAAADKAAARATTKEAVKKAATTTRQETVSGCKEMLEQTRQLERVRVQARGAAYRAAATKVDGMRTRVSNINSLKVSQFASMLRSKPSNKLGWVLGS